MTDGSEAAVSSRGATWRGTAYTSAIPNFKGAPEMMFHAPPGWATPDPAWQREHQGWEPDVLEVPVAGWPLTINHWYFWISKHDLRRRYREIHARRAATYGFYVALYPLAFLGLVAGIIFLIYPPAGIFTLFVAGETALLGAFYLWLVVTPILWLSDGAYLRALRRGRRGDSLTRWTLGPIITLLMVATIALALLFCWAIAPNWKLDILSLLTLIGALTSLVASIPAAAMYALRELRLQR